VCHEDDCRSVLTPQIQQHACSWSRVT
jgi:hypothetical protein